MPHPHPTHPPTPSGTPAGTTSPSSGLARRNNFDLLRLFAASQVLLFHGMEHLHLTVAGRPLEVLFALLKLFPGVPVFFVISGFLISMSFERNPRLWDFARNRFLRIYPALWVCFCVGILSLFLAGYWPSRMPHVAHAVPWILAQLSIGQFYNPTFLRGYGVGVINGSLWTIPVELEFYLLLPLVYWGCRLLRSRRNGALLALLLAFAAFHVVFFHAYGQHRQAIALKLVSVSVLPYLYTFLVGVLIQRNFARIERWLRGRALIWLVAYVALAAALDRLGMRTVGNNLNPLSFLVLAATTISCAYTAPGWSRRLLGHFDISYGTYIYHMIIINLLVAEGLVGEFRYLFVAMVVTYLVAIASWVAIERPALALKRNALHPVGPAVEPSVRPYV